MAQAVRRKGHLGSLKGCRSPVSIVFIHPNRYRWSSHVPQFPPINPLRRQRKGFSLTGFRAVRNQGHQPPLTVIVTPVNLTEKRFMVSEVVSRHHGGHPLPRLNLHPVDGSDNVVVFRNDPLDITQPVLSLPLFKYLTRRLRNRPVAETSGRQSDDCDYSVSSDLPPHPGVAQSISRSVVAT